jgi:hypothetical protein
MQEEGKRLLKSLNMLPDLAEFGTVQVQGSFLYGLMVKRDIDIYVLIDEYDLAKVADYAHKLIVSEKIGKTSVDNMRMERVLIKGVPNGHYLGLNVPFEGSMWNFDIWFVKKEDLIDQSNFPLGWENKLSQEQRDSILFLKHNLSEIKLYPHSSKVAGSFASADVYRAVMNDGIKTIDELQEWRKTHPFY